MSDPHLPAARAHAPFRSRAAARARSILRPLGRFLATAVPVVLVLGAIGGSVFGIYSCSERETAEKSRECRALNWSRDRVERIVRSEEGIRAYVQDPGTPVLREYAFKDAMPFSEIVFIMDVPAADPIRFVSTAQLNPSDQCIQRTEFHVRSARDIE